MSSGEPRTRLARHMVCEKLGRSGSIWFTEYAAPVITSPTSGHMICIDLRPFSALTL